MQRFLILQVISWQFSRWLRLKIASGRVKRNRGPVFTNCHFVPGPVVGSRWPWNIDVLSEGPSSGVTRNVEIVLIYFQIVASLPTNACSCKSVIHFQQQSLFIFFSASGIFTGPLRIQNILLMPILGRNLMVNISTSQLRICVIK
jgi:hypothetical protein